MAARLVTGVFFQPSKAAAAALTAARASSAEEAWKRPTTSRVSAGLMSRKVWPLALGRQSPSMQLRKVAGGAVVMAGLQGSEGVDKNTVYHRRAQESSRPVSVSSDRWVEF